MLREVTSKMWSMPCCLVCSWKVSTLPTVGLMRTDSYGYMVTLFGPWDYPSSPLLVMDMAQLDNGIVYMEWFHGTPKYNCHPSIYSCIGWLLVKGEVSTLFVLLPFVIGLELLKAHMTCGSFLYTSCLVVTTLRYLWWARLLFLLGYG